MRLFGLLMAFGVAALPTLTQDGCPAEETPTPGPDAGPDATVIVFEGIHQRFGAEDTRTVSTEVDFPDEAWHYAQVLLHYTLSCPEGGCDPWDRTASIEVIDPESGLAVEVARFITPYGVGYGWTVDVTDLRPILAGHRQVRAFIDTWVDPGWLVDLSLEFIGGEPVRRAVAIVPLQRGYFTYGNPDDPLEDHLTPVVADLPVDFSDATVRVLATGHGFGYTENCAEFCPKDHTLLVDDVSDTEVLWRDDCVFTAAPNQAGTWWYARAGWCPGADVRPRVWEVASKVDPGQTAQFGYQVEPYINTVDGGDPYLILSAYLVLYQ